MLRLEQHHQAMDPPQAGFDELERAFRDSMNTIKLADHFHGSLKRETTYVSRNVPTTYADIPDSEIENGASPVSPISHDGLDMFVGSITPPPQPHSFNSHFSGLPPTPPTMTNSDIAESKPDRLLSPAPLFADRVRNALESQKSGLTTPGLEQHSPPTPEASPPGTVTNLFVPRPPLKHSASSFADSFKTAHEGTTPDGSTSNIALPLEEAPEKNWWEDNSPISLKGLALEDERLPYDKRKKEGPDVGGDRAKSYYLNTRLYDDSSAGEARSKDYHFSSSLEDSDTAEPGVGNHTTESDAHDESDGGQLRTQDDHTSPSLDPELNTDNRRAKSYRSSSDRNEESDRGEVRVKNYHMESDTDTEKNASQGDDNSIFDSALASPTLRKSLSHRAAYNRLRKPIQPGESVRRPDEALLYSVPRSVMASRILGVGRPTAPPPPNRERDVKVVRNALPAHAPAADPTPGAPVVLDGNHSPIPAQSLPPVYAMSDEAPPNLHEFTPSTAPIENPSPPSTAAEESLEENNIVYKLIQEENAKRHSAISDGSVQARVFSAPANKRRLRHTPKRESLRGDTSLASNSKHSSSESGHKLKHKHRVNSLGGSELLPEATPEHAKPTKFSARISRFNPGENGLDYWSALPDEHTGENANGLSSRRDWRAKAPPRRTYAELQTMKPRRLRRSLPGRNVDRNSLVGDDIEGLGSPEDHPESAGVDVSGERTPSPQLRRYSAEKRLVYNNDVGRTSLGRHSHTLSQKLAYAAQDLTQEGRELPESDSLRHRRTSSNEKTSITPPRRMSFDYRHLHPTTTPLSISQFSDRTEAELCEARGVELFPHNNRSLLFIDESAERRTEQTRSLPEESADEEVTFQAFVLPPVDSGHQIGVPLHTVDSPLTNPRAAPAPPVIHFIPPTPCEEIERTLGDPPITEGRDESRPAVQRRPSLAQRVRRYSASLVQPLPFGRAGSVRRRTHARASSMEEARPTHLSSFWQPREFWADYDSADDDYDDDDEYEPLPPGGDTSSINDTRRAFFPRNMSVRMPGFRGHGGFLQGNSLGLDRHGTNNRRHHVDRRASEEMLRRLAKRRTMFTVPFTGGARVEYVGLAAFKARVREVKKKRHDRALEKRRETLRGQIGTRVYHHDGRCGVP